MTSSTCRSATSNASDAGAGSGALVATGCGI